MAFTNIDKPDSFLGVESFERSNGSPRNPFDAAHGFGDALWRNAMGNYQELLDPNGEFGFHQEARYNGALVANRAVDAAVLGTTAHGNHGKSVNELHWSSNPETDGMSFAQSIEAEFKETLKDLNADLLAGDITQAEFDSAVRDARINAILDHIAFTKTMKAGYLRQDILDAAGHSDIKHIAINAQDPAFDTAAEVSAHNESIRDSYSTATLEQTDLYRQNRALVEEVFDPVLRAEGPKSQAVIDAADKALNQRLVDNFEDYARLFPEVDTPDRVRANVIATEAIMRGNADDLKSFHDRLQNDPDTRSKLVALETNILDDLRNSGAFPDGDHDKLPDTISEFYNELTRHYVRANNFEKARSSAETYHAGVRGLDAALIDRVNEAFDNRGENLRQSAVDGDSPNTKVKAGGIIGGVGMVFAGLAVFTKYQAETVDDPQSFDEWAARKAPQLIASLPATAGLVGGVALLAMAGPMGLAFTIAFGAAEGYVVFKEFLQDYITANEQYEDNKLVPLARLALDTLAEFEKTNIYKMAETAARVMAEYVIEPFFKLLTPEILSAAGESVLFNPGPKAGDPLQKNPWLVGEDLSILVGNDENDVLIHFGAGEAYGLDGNDWLIAYKPDFYEAGDRVGQAPGAGEEDTRPEVDQETALLLDGGRGNDVVLAAIGEKAETVGGEGRDWIWNTSKGGVIYGDTKDGAIAGANGERVSVPDSYWESSNHSDNFWYWPETTIMDARPNDVLKFYGMPLTGGKQGVPMIAFGPRATLGGGGRSGGARCAALFRSVHDLHELHVHGQ
ncbi:hypothetical protein AB2N04_00900 (plasmid) [Nitratireductor sp. GISD-1A_MAKvit]|uniref:hypothetical protein n=1 Tax=Nitratireductor sp. GISD-1A_MAKvit TaxID=3234198 RepID=UPI003465A41D